MNIDITLRHDQTERNVEQVDLERHGSVYVLYIYLKQGIHMADNPYSGRTATDGLSAHGFGDGIHLYDHRTHPGVKLETVTILEMDMFNFEQGEPTLHCTNGDYQQDYVQVIYYPRVDIETIASIKVGGN